MVSGISIHTASINMKSCAATFFLWISNLHFRYIFCVKESDTVYSPALPNVNISPTMRHILFLLSISKISIKTSNLFTFEYQYMYLKSVFEQMLNVLRISILGISLRLKIKIFHNLLRLHKINTWVAM